MNASIVFGEFLRLKRAEAKLTQEQLAEVIGKTGMYISNIEKGKNSSPPNQGDLSALADRLSLEENDRVLFFEKAAQDRATLPRDMIDYIYQCPSLKQLIRIAIENNIPDSLWGDIVNSYTRMG